MLLRTAVVFRFPAMMKALIPERKFNLHEPEMMDRPDSDPEILRDDLKNLRTINKYFGGLAVVRKHVLPLFDMVPPEQEIRVLDLATGSADHPVALVKQARTLQRRIRITAVDRNPVMLAVARERTRNIPEIEIQDSDILSLPFGAKSYDIVVCSLVLHHVGDQQAVDVLRNIRRIARVGWIINDLNRSWPAAWTAWLYAHLSTRNPMTRSDSYISILRAFTASELREIARQAGARSFEVFEEPFFRLVLVGRS